MSRSVRYTGRVAVTVLLALLSIVLFSGRVLAYCPSNGNTHAVYVTSNLGDNIWSFDSQGTYIGDVLNKDSFPEDVQVQKLRAMRFGPHGYLYVSSARGSYSRIFAVSGNGVLNATLGRNCTRNYLFTVVQQEKGNPLLDHPYDMVFHPDTNDLFVANQNSATVTKYAYKEAARQAYPEWTPVANAKEATGRAVSLAETDEEGNVTPADIPDNVGLFASAWSSAYAMSSVRGLALSPRLPKALVDGTAPPGYFPMDNDTTMYYLAVCDMAANVVHVFDPTTGTRLFGLNVPSPVQVVFPGRTYSSVSTTAASGVELRSFEVPYIYVTSKEDAMAYMIRFTSRSGAIAAAGEPAAVHGLYEGENSVARHRMFAITRPTPLHAAAGIYENPARDVVFVADRNGRHISSYASPYLSDFVSTSGPAAFLGYFVKQLPDQPEFIATALLENQKNVPFCYELAPSGEFRYVALCTAAYIWSVVLALVLVAVPSLLIFRQVQHCFRSRRHQQRKRAAAAAAEGDAESVPLVSASSRPGLYGTSS